MAISYDTILTEFVRVAQEGVGSQLSQIGPVGSEFPAVIRARTGGTQPDYPYIQLDVLSTTQTSGWLLGEGVDENEDAFVESQYKLLLQYTVYGGSANQIAHDLESYFRLNRVLNEIEINTTGTLEDTFDVLSLPESLSTENLEVAAFNLTFNIADRYVDPATGVFDTINLDGELLRKESDPNPINLDVSVTSVTP